VILQMHLMVGEMILWLGCVFHLRSAERLDAWLLNESSNV